MNKSEFVKENKNGVIYFRSDKIKAPHGFSTRLGGVSTIPHLSQMNLGKNLGDDPALVEENYRRMGRAVGFDSNTVVFTNQIHSSTVLEVTKKDVGKTYDCDGFVTKEEGVTLAVRTADCVPILFYDSENCVAGAVHAGWRGTVNGIQQNAIAKMISLGANADKIHCAIGACIRKCCYRVGDDFINEVIRLQGKDFAQSFIEYRDNVPYADLVAMNVKLICDKGVAKENIDISPDCTCCDPQLYFSHRASGGKRGVMSAFISLPLF